MYNIQLKQRQIESVLENEAKIVVAADLQPFAILELAKDEGTYVIDGKASI